MSDATPDAAVIQAKLLKLFDLHLDKMLRTAQAKTDPFRVVYWSLAGGFTLGFALGCGAALAYTRPIDWFAFVIMPFVVGILGCIAVWAGRRFIP